MVPIDGHGISSVVEILAKLRDAGPSGDASGPGTLHAPIRRTADRTDNVNRSGERLNRQCQSAADWCW